MALANQYRFAETKFELEQIDQLMKDSSLYIPFSPFSPSIDGAIVAQNLLKGTLALKEKRMSDALAAFNKAAITEENMVYNEPRDWMLNPKQYLGNTFLENNDGVNAEKIFIKDLLNNKENGWALFGLYKALSLQRKNAEAAKVMERYKNAFRNADINITSSVY